MRKIRQGVRVRFRIGVVAAVTLWLGVTQTEISGHGGLRRSDPRWAWRSALHPGRYGCSSRSSRSRRCRRSAPRCHRPGLPGRTSRAGCRQSALTHCSRAHDQSRNLLGQLAIVSAVDGHATAGTFAFGVRMVPTHAAFAGSTINRPPSRFEMLARGLFIAGLVLLIGAAAATSAHFGGPSDVGLAASGVILSVIGLALPRSRKPALPMPHSPVFSAQRSVGRSSVEVRPLRSPASLLIALIRPATGPRALSAAGIAALAAAAVHVGSGHAAAGGKWHFAVGVAVQWTHFVATGVWLGGLAALLLAIRGAPSNTRTELVHRFSGLAPVGLVMAGYRRLSQLRRAGEMERSDIHRLRPYGVGEDCTDRSDCRRRGREPAAYVSRASLSLRPLRRVASGELLLMVMALGAAAVLGTLPPPISGFDAVRPLKASGSDFGTTVRVDLTTASDQPGPNDFSVRAVDYDSRQPVQAQRISLRFTPLDDPGIAPTSLSLERGRDNLFSGSGANLAFDGRWQVAVLVEGATDSVAVPLNLDVRGPLLMVSPVRVPDMVPHYTVEVPRIGHVQIARIMSALVPTRCT